MTAGVSRKRAGGTAWAAGGSAGGGEGDSGAHISPGVGVRPGVCGRSEGRGGVPSAAAAAGGMIGSVSPAPVGRAARGLPRRGAPRRPWRGRSGWPSGAGRGRRCSLRRSRRRGRGAGARTRGGPCTRRGGGRSSPTAEGGSVGPRAAGRVGGEWERGAEEARGVRARHAPHEGRAGGWDGGRSGKGGPAGRRAWSRYVAGTPRASSPFRSCTSPPHAASYSSLRGLSVTFPHLSSRHSSTKKEAASTLEQGPGTGLRIGTRSGAGAGC